MTREQQIAAKVAKWIHLDENAWQRQPHILMTIEALIDNPELIQELQKIVDSSILDEVLG